MRLQEIFEEDLGYQTCAYSDDIYKDRLAVVLKPNTNLAWLGAICMDRAAECLMSEMTTDDDHLKGNGPFWLAMTETVNCFVSSKVVSFGQDKLLFFPSVVVNNEAQEDAEDEELHDP